MNPASSWLRPVSLVEKVGHGYFKLNDRTPRTQTDSSVVWSDIEFPKVSRDVYSDKFRIQSFSCLFELSPETHLQALTAVQLVFESLENPDLVIAAPLNGVKTRSVAWSYQLFLQPTETIIGMKHGYLSSDLIVKTSLGRVVSMKSGEELEDTEVWTLPFGFRVYCFHGFFDGHIRFLGPIFKAMELKQWDHAFYKKLPTDFKKNFQMMVHVKNRHRKEPPNDTIMDFWKLPEVAWDKIAHELLCGAYYDMDVNRFFQSIQLFYTR